MDQTTNINATVKEKVKTFARLARSAGVPVEEVIVYGSQAKGTATDWSDIDVCVVMRQAPKNTDAYFKKIWHLASIVDTSIEPIPFTRAELSNQYSSLASEIRTYGIRIV